MPRRVVSLWFPRLASDRFLRARPVDGPFALTQRQSNTERIYCLNQQAVQQGLQCGMGFSDARAFCRDLQSHPADPVGAQRYRRHGRGGAAWALAHYGEGVAAQDQPLDAIGPLPVAALRLDEKSSVGLQRLGVRSIADLVVLPRATVARRFGVEVLLRLDQATGEQAEHISPLPDPPRYQVRLTLPDPIGLEADVMAGTGRLLETLCDKLKTQEMGARVLSLIMRRVDKESQEVAILGLGMLSCIRKSFDLLQLHEK